MLDGATLTPGGRGRAWLGRRARSSWRRRPARATRDARAAIAALLERGEPLYGATTGVGALRDRTIGDADRERFQWNLLRSHAVSAGRPLAPELVRAGHGGARQPARRRWRRASPRPCSTRSSRP